MLRSPVVVFAARAALFLALQFGICAALVPLAYRREQRDYMAATIDKHARLDAQRGARRLFIAGGSSAAFGFDSAAIEAATGRAVTNLGLHAALGLPFILAEAESAAGPGDVVWLSPEFHFYWCEPELAEEMWAYLCARPAGFADLRYEPVKTLLDHGPFQFAGHVVRAVVPWLRFGTKPAGKLYARALFEEHGDIVPRVGEKPKRPLGIDVNDSPIQEERLLASLQLLARVVRSCERKGAEVRIVLPPLHEGLMRGYAARVERVVAELERAFPGQVIGDAGSVAEPDDHFFDTPLHLTREAAKARTQRVLAAAGIVGGEAGAEAARSGR